MISRVLTRIDLARRGLGGVPVQLGDRGIALLQQTLGAGLLAVEAVAQVGVLLLQRDQAPDVGAVRRTAHALKPHTDNCDMIALLSVRSARVGGFSSVASAYTVHERLREQRPDLLERLYVGEQHHRRGEEAPGDDPITPHRIPVFSVTDDKLSIRFVRPDMDDALKAQGRSDALLAEAFDAVERIAGDAAFTFALQPGELLLLNNLVVLHARTGFQDRDDPARQRLLLRLSLDEPGFRARSPLLDLHANVDGVPHVPGRTAAYANV